MEPGKAVQLRPGIGPYDVRSQGWRCGYAHGWAATGLQNGVFLPGVNG